MSTPLNPQQFFHGTDADLEPGDVVQPGIKVGKSLATKVWTTTHAPMARAFGSNVYKVEPVDGAEMTEEPLYSRKDVSSRVGHAVIQTAPSMRVVERFTPRTGPAPTDMSREKEIRGRREARIAQKRAENMSPEQHRQVSDIMDLL